MGISMQYIENILISKGFRIIDQNISESFGDYFYTYSNDVFELRFVSDRSIKSIEIKNIENDECYYDLALVKFLLYKEQNLKKIISFETLSFFLIKEVESISRLFNKNNYSTTKMNLENIFNERVKQMFPKL